MEMTTWLVFVGEAEANGFSAYGPFQTEAWGDLGDEEKRMRVGNERQRIANLVMLQSGWDSWWECDIEKPSGDDTGYDPDGRAVVFTASMFNSGGSTYTFAGPFRDLDAAKAWAEKNGFGHRNAFEAFELIPVEVKEEATA